MYNNRKHFKGGNKVNYIKYYSSITKTLDQFVSPPPKIKLFSYCGTARQYKKIKYVLRGTNRLGY